MMRSESRGVGWSRPGLGICLMLCGAAWGASVLAQTRPAVRTAEQRGRVAPPPGLWRQSDRRPVVNRAAAEAQGIARFESRRLVLYTDIPREQAEPLLGLMDQAYDAWVALCGELPPDRERTEFQMTGYVMADQRRFRTAGLLPDSLPSFEHGRHRGQEFWMNDQGSDYYRAHLLLHEGTHCFTTAVDRDLTRSVWLFEGIAEYFATHRISREGHSEFRVWPKERAAFPLLGRIRLLEEHRSRSETLSMVEVARQSPEGYDQPDAYAWAWALVYFLAELPETRESFREIIQGVVRGESHGPLDGLLADARRQRLWRWYVADLCHGYDLTRALPLEKDFDEGEELGREISITANRGWQGMGVRMKGGRSYRVSAQGRVTLATQPRDWTSEPAGISIRYHAGLPLGRLVGRFWPADTGLTEELETFSVGSQLVYRPSEDGILFLRVNDFWNELDDNSGEYRVSITLQE